MGRRGPDPRHISGEVREPLNETAATLLPACTVAWAINTRDGRVSKRRYRRTRDASNLTLSVQTTSSSLQCTAP